MVVRIKNMNVLDLGESVGGAGVICEFGQWELCTHFILVLFCLKFFFGG